MRIEKHCPAVVGIGASAGGICAFRALIETLPSKFDMALVFIQHLTPDKKNFLPESLQSQRSDLIIQEVASETVPVSGRIYFQPPAFDLVVEKGMLKPVKIPQTRSHFPIDRFFITLAQEYKEQTIAVILSGAGTDGTRGAQFIRSMGGAVLVQDPAYAEFTGMPQSVISAGYADQILETKQIIPAILKIKYMAMTRVPVIDNIAEPADYEQLLRLIHQKTGYCFNRYKQSVIIRRVQRRLCIHGLTRIEDYSALLDDKPDEASALVDDFMIGVTSFFRDRDRWDTLRTNVVAPLVAQRSDTPIRVWTPGCATGEEAYSVAMLLHAELYRRQNRRDMQVFATDINQRALERARHGLYPESVTVDIPSEFLQAYFTCTDNPPSVVIGKQIREHVIFAYHNVLTDPPFSRLDLVICRNLLIYLQPDAQQKCIDMFNYALNPGGFLFLGNAETIGNRSSLFKPVTNKHAHLYQKTGTRKPACISLPPGFSHGSTFKNCTKAKTIYDKKNAAELVHQRLLQQYAPAAVGIDAQWEIFCRNGPIHRYLTHTRGEETNNLLDHLPRNLHTRLRTAMRKALQNNTPISIRTAFSCWNKQEIVTISISPIDIAHDLMLVTFRGNAKRVESNVSPSSLQGDERTLQQLEHELNSIREDNQRNIEQLESLNEELQSSNEELRAANEEIGTSREELQSLNEELVTVNNQLQEKVTEQDETNNDLNNFISSAGIPTLFLDKKCNIRRFTPAMTDLIKLLPSDQGRSLFDLSHENLGPDLVGDISSVLRQLIPRKKEFAINNIWYIRTILPYRTLDNRIEGVVVNYIDISDRKHIEEELESISRFPAENPSPVLRIDRSGTILFINSCGQKLLQPLNCTIGNRIPLQWHRTTTEAYKNQETRKMEIECRQRIYQLTIVPIPQSSYINIYGADITERRQAQATLKESEERFRTMFERHGAMMLLIDPDNGAIINANSAAVSFYGYSRELLCTMTIQQINQLPPEHVATQRHKAEKKQQNVFQFPHRLADGRIRTVEVYSSPISIANRSLLFSIIHDITERQAAEESLRYSEERYRLLFEKSNDAILLIDPHTKMFVDCNSKAEQMTGYSREQLRTIDATMLLPSHLRDSALEIPKRDDDGAMYGETQILTAQGRLLDVEFSMATITFKGEHVLQNIMRDISERKRIEHILRRNTEKLAAANKELEAFSYSVSHDLRAPLRTMKGFCEILLEDYSNILDTVGQDYLRRIVKGADTMSTLIDDMLDLAKISRQEIHFQQVNLSSIAASIVEELRQQSPQRDAAVVIHENITAYGDPRLLHIALTNLLGNAWKYTGKTSKPRIEFGSYNKDNEIIFFIRDNGAGFSMEYADKLFKPFQRLHSESEFSGTGVGLPIVQRVINRHGGRIWAEAEIGKGAAFYFTLQ